MSISKSAQKLVPKEPPDVMVIRDVTPVITTLSLPFERMGLMKIGGRATLVKLQTGSVAVFSPVALTPAVEAKVAQMGTMKYIIAPDFEHHIYITPWSRKYPNAEVIGPEGLPEKRESDEANKGIKFSHVFTKSNKRDLKIGPEFDAEFEYEYFDAHQNKELVFLHKPSKTVIEADLVFNLPAHEQYSKQPGGATSGIFTKLFGSLANARGEVMAQRRLLWYVIGAKDRPSFAESSRRVMAWDFDRVVPCHGDVIETGGKDIIGKATAWFREAH